MKRKKKNDLVFNTLCSTEGCTYDEAQQKIDQLNEKLAEIENKKKQKRWNTLYWLVLSVIFAALASIIIYMIYLHYLIY